MTEATYSKARSTIEKEEKEKELKAIKEFISSDEVMTVDYKLAPWMAEKVCACIDRLKKLVYENLSVGNHEYLYPFSQHDNLMFYGDGGLAYMNLHLFLKQSERTNYDLLNEAVRLIDKPLRKSLNMERLTFLAGDAGLVTLAAVLYHYIGRRPESKELLNRLVRGIHEVTLVEAMPNDLLTGRAGYLFCMLFARKHIGVNKDNPITDDLVRKVFNQIIKQGRQLAASQGRGKTLLFVKALGAELGARSGMASVLHTLMQVDVPDLLSVLHEYLPGTLEYMMPMKLGSGNRPHSETSNQDLNTAWWQGAGGWVHLFLKAYKLLEDRIYLEAAMEGEEYVWRHGYSNYQDQVHSLCNGMPGNGYCHLALYATTRNLMYFKRACSAGLRCFNYNATKNIQLRPFSLMNGLSGSICFLSDLLSPLDANFPCYEL